MTILFYGTEEVGFKSVTNLVATTNTAYFRNTRSRCALAGPSLVAESHSFAAQTTLYVSFRGYWRWYNSAAGLVIQFLNSNGVRWAVGWDSTGHWNLQKWNGSSWTVLATAASTGYTDSLLQYHVKLVIGSSGSFTLWAGATEVVTYSGDTRAGTANVDVSSTSVKIASININKEWFGLSEVVIGDEDTKSYEVMTLPVNGAGDANGWAAGTYTAVDEITEDRTDTLSTGVIDQDVQLALGNLPAGEFSVYSVAIGVGCVKTQNSVVGNLKIGVKSGGTIDAGSNQALGSQVWGNLRRQMDTNPVTSSPWLNSEVDALQVNLRSAT